MISIPIGGALELRYYLNGIQGSEIATHNDYDQVV